MCFTIESSVCFTIEYWIRILKIEIFRDGCKPLKHILTRLCGFALSCLDLVSIKVHFKSVLKYMLALTDFPTGILNLKADSLLKAVDGNSQ